MNTEQRITYSVAFKAVIDLVGSGEVEFETSDVVAEAIELTDAFYEALAVRQGLDEDAPKATRSRKSASKPSRSSGKRDSNRRSSTKTESKGPKDPNADASPAQIGFLKKLLKENDVDFDEGFDLDGEEYYFDEFTMGSIQVPIEYLKE
jgi:hypothetical protein